MSQHMDALHKGNEIRLARAALKGDVKRGEKTVAGVLADNPPEVATMTVTDLIAAQHRWGTERARRWVAAQHVGESKTIGTLTDRQRGVLVAAAEAWR